MDLLRRTLRAGFARIEALLDRVFPPAWQPLYHLGALSFFCLWIVFVSGLYVYAFFDTGTVDAFQSVESMSTRYWWHAGVMRSLHRYASAGMVLFMFLHLLREFAIKLLKDHSLKASLRAKRQRAALSPDFRSQLLAPLSNHFDA